MASRTSTLRPRRKGGSRADESRHGQNAGATDPHCCDGAPSPEHAAYLQALSENNPLGIVVLDLNGRVKMCNPAFERLFGYKAAEILGANLDSLLSPPQIAEEAAHLTRRAAIGETVRASTQRRRRDGALVDVEVVGVPLVLAGKRFGSFAMYEDISERRQAEEAKRRAEEKFRSLFENAVEGIFLTTVDGLYISVNPAQARMFGYASPEQMLASAPDVAQMYAEPQFREEFKRLIEERGVVEGLEYQIRRKDGSRVWISENAHAV